MLLQVVCCVLMGLDMCVVTGGVLCTDGSGQVHVQPHHHHRAGGAVTEQDMCG